MADANFRDTAIINRDIRETDVLFAADPSNADLSAGARRDTLAEVIRTIFLNPPNLNSTQQLAFRIAFNAQSGLLTVTQSEAQAGTETTSRLWSPRRVADAIAALATSGLTQNQVDARIVALVLNFARSSAIDIPSSQIPSTIARLANPNFTGLPRAPTASPGDNDTSIATTAFVQAALAALSTGSALRFGSGAPGSSLGDNGDSYLDTDAGGFYSKTSGSWALEYTDQAGTGGGLTQAQVDARVNALALRKAQNLADLANVVTARTNLGLGSAAEVDTGTANGDVPLLGAGGDLAVGVVPASIARIASPNFTGNPRAPTPSASDSDTSIATTAFVQAAIAAGAPVLTHTRYAALKANNGFNAADFTAAGTSASSTTDDIEVPAFAAARYLAFAIPFTQPDLTDIRETGSDFSSFSFFTKSNTNLTIGGSAHKVWISTAALLANADAQSWTLT